MGPDCDLTRTFMIESTSYALQLCPGCGSRLPATEGPTHDYMSSSLARWAAFNTIMAREYSNPILMPVHRLSVDAWAVQHLGEGSRRAIQSGGLHLARLMAQLEDDLGFEAANALMLRISVHKAALPELSPRPRYKMTVANVVDADAPENHIRQVRLWAETTLSDWADEHEYIRDWFWRIPSPSR